MNANQLITQEILHKYYIILVSNLQELEL